MRILVLGGSPKGESSVTIRYVRYLEKRFPFHGWKTEHVASRIAALEKDEGKFTEIIDEVRGADLILWAFPLYYLLVCSQLKRFIELVDARGASAAFSGKYAASVSTSIHFYDHTAHTYIREVSEDWGLRFVSSYSAAMADLTKVPERSRLDLFAQDLFSTVSSGALMPRRSFPLDVRNGPSAADALREAPPPVSHSRAVKAAVLVDNPDSPAGRMADRAALSLLGAERIDLGSLGLSHGCLGCLKCGAGDCAYTGKDSFIDTFRRVSAEADVVVFAGTVRDRYLSWLWKAFFDRSFFKTHRPSLNGKRVVVLVSGPLTRLDNLREVLSAYFETMEAHVVDFVSDESLTAAELASAIDSAVSRAVLSVGRAREEGLSLAASRSPISFRGVGGMKIFRDEIYGGLRIVFKGDHREYRKSKRYDFPLRNPFARLGVWIAYWFTSIPFIKRGMRENMVSFMVKSFEKVIEGTEPKNAPAP